MTDPQATQDKPVGELFQEFSEQTSRLVRQELQLAQLELKEKGKHAGIGAGLFGGAGVMAFYGGALLLATIVLVLSELGLDGWLAALIVAVVVFAIAGVLVLTGKKQVDQATPAAPEQAIATTKTSVDTVKARAKR